MKMLGTDVSLHTVRLDLVFLHASLLADDRAEIQALAGGIGVLLEQLRTERELYERAEDAAVVMTARQQRRDNSLDRLVLTFGGVLRSVNARLYELFFPTLSPSGVGRASLERELTEVTRILGELARLPADDAQRVAYEAPLRSTLDALEAAHTSSEQADTALTLASSRVAQFKHRVDRVRVETHGRLLTLLGDKKTAGEFFRPTTASPSAAEDSAPAAPAAPAGH